MIRALTRSILGVCVIAACSSKPSTGKTSEASLPPKDAAAATPAPGGGAPGLVTGGADSAFKKGQARWKDCGVYVDGKPVGFLTFGELPVALKPTWMEEEASIPLKPGYKGPQTAKIKQRAYKLYDYLVAAGVDVAKVKEVHVYGPRFTDSIIVGGDEFRKKKDDLLFHFGGDVRGKPIPIVPDEYGNNRSPDKITSIMVYIDKKPPKLERNVGLVLDGEVQIDVPYYGEPLRGGVRVYLDDRLATTIKRKALDEVAADDGKIKLLDYIKAQGVDTSKVVEGWVIKDDRRAKKLTQAELASAVFQIAVGAEGKVLVGDLPANALALHSHVLKADELPQVLPGEDGDKVDWPKGESN